MLDWKNRALSYAGRCQDEIRKEIAKVSWESICRSKDQGGLGLKDLQKWNETLVKTAMECASYERHFVRENIRFVVGSGKNTSAWYDNWHPMGPLSNVISKRDVYDARLSDQCIVDEAIKRGVWKWPNEWFGRYPILNNYGVPHLNEYRRDIDRVLRWKPNEDLKCPLCEECNDSHEHLFFTLTKLVCGATVYYIWNERNARLFGSNKRNEEAICHEIEDTVRLRLVNLKVKESNAVRNVEKLWKIKLQRCNTLIFRLRSGNYNGCY
ncbi:hypothetical protein Tco_0947756 [Tanacetum coccineum]